MRRVQRRDLGRLDPVQLDIDQRGIETLIIKRAKDAGVIGAGGGKDILPRAAVFIQRPLNQRAVCQRGFQILMALDLKA